MYRRLIPTVMVILFVAVSAGGCVDNDMSIRIAYNLAPDDSCQYQIGDIGEVTTYFARGMLDLNYLEQVLLLDDPGIPLYRMTLGVYNFLLNNADDDIGRLNSMDVRLEKIRMSYKWILGREQLVNDPFAMQIEAQPVEVHIAGYIGASGGVDDPGTLIFPISAIPYAVGNNLDASVLASLDENTLDQVTLRVGITLIGRTLGEVRVETAEFHYPISFCHDCITNPDPAVCPTGTEPVDGCVRGQDYFICVPSEEGS